MVTGVTQVIGGSEMTRKYVPDAGFPATHCDMVKTVIADEIVTHEPVAEVTPTETLTVAPVVTAETDHGDSGSVNA